jgi:hypothetical protein
LATRDARVMRDEFAAREPNLMVGQSLIHGQTLPQAGTNGNMYLLDIS